MIPPRERVGVVGHLWSRRCDPVSVFVTHPKLWDPPHPPHPRCHPLLEYRHIHCPSTVVVVVAESNSWCFWNSQIICSDLVKLVIGSHWVSSFSEESHSTRWGTQDHSSSSVCLSFDGRKILSDYILIYRRGSCRWSWSETFHSQISHPYPGSSWSFSLLRPLPNSLSNTCSTSHTTPW